MFKKKYQIPSELIQNDYEHVHHADTVRLLETSRIDLFKAMGKTLEDYFANGILIVVYDLQITYKRELFEGEIEVICSNGIVQGKSIFIDQEIKNQKGKTAVQAKIELKMVSTDTKRSIEPSQSFLELLKGATT